MLKSFCRFIDIMLAFLILTIATPCLAEIEYFDIFPGLKKIPTAVPVFKQMQTDAAEAEKALKAADLLSGALDFSGYFKIMDRKSFLIDPEKFGIMTSQINFPNWTGIGAELLVTGGILLKEGIVELEMRLFDTIKQTMLVGRRYKGRSQDLRRMVHLFAKEIVFRLTGNQGVFDTRIAFLSTKGKSKEIFICDFDGYQPRQFTHDNSIVLSPSWSSDGKWMAYTSYSRGRPELFIKHIRDKRGAIVAQKGINSSPAWIPGKNALAATLSFSGDQEIYMLTGKGKIIKRLTYNQGIDTSPTWSPDGSKMAFVSRRAGSPQIYIKDIKSGHTRRLTFQGNYNTEPSWSPKGNKIAFSAMEKGEANIYVINPDGSNLMQLTRDAGNNESPSWSPDGSLIVFSSTREGVGRIYVMTAFGTDQRRLLKMPGVQSQPRWSPRVVN